MHWQRARWGQTGGQVGKGNSSVHGIARETAFVGKVCVAPLERTNWRRGW